VSEELAHWRIGVIWSPEGRADLRIIHLEPAMHSSGPPSCGRLADAWAVKACDAKMCHMAKASVRDLRYRLAEVEGMLREGEEIQITKRKRVIVTLVPAKAPILKKIYGAKTLKVSGAALLAKDRGRH